ncbi:endonuclease/exonuclease/phosphatase family protein [Parapedobacter lycopersici]|uniref:endonuclease/exonuclease/phosphatase family protein n=1 Tax=Parapedobacter lycopersici TaxID=1864939 RepID=UPI00214D2857|nr:endonuclease/exonuclease/phosphatase family protein [Parapedobacter lycopersici]
MKTHYFFIFLFLAAINCSQAQQQAQPGFRVASYNIRYAAEADEQSGNGWDIRKQPLSELISSHGFDIVGTQEGNTSQLADLSELLPGYAYLAHPYGGQDGLLSNCAIFYKAARFDALDSGVFWLSETPDMPSIGWDASDRRICYWTQFREKETGKTFFFFNVHFYWRKHIAKEQSGPLLARKIREIAGSQPVICTGDFNSLSETTQIQAVKGLLSDAYEVTQTPRVGVEGTGFPGGVFQGQPGGRIDYIFVSPHFQVVDYRVLSDTYNGDHYPSDHLPVTSWLSWSTETAH